MPADPPASPSPPLTHAGPTPAPLTDADLRLAESTTRRVCDEVRALLSALPAEARSASGLAQHLRIDRTTCQRVVFAVSRPFDGPHVVDRLPGVKGLRQLTGAARAAGADEGRVAALEAAVDQFESMIGRLAGSQSRLIRRIAATPLSVGVTPDGAETASGLALRRRLFEAAAAVTGRASDINVSLFIFRPLAGDHKRMERALATGVIGHTARPDAIPLVFNTGRLSADAAAAAAGETPQGFTTLDRSPAAGRTPEAVLAPFSSDPLPTVSSRRPLGSGPELLQVIDAAPGPEGGGTPAAFDLVVANLAGGIGPHPATETPPIEEVWTLSHYPSRHLVFDVYLHRDMARLCIPDLSVHLWRPNMQNSIGDRWYSRFPSGPRLQLLGTGTSSAHSDVYPRQSDLARHLFSRLGWNEAEFIGYRCELAYPIWRAGYCMSFDFAGARVD